MDISWRQIEVRFQPQHGHGADAAPTIWRTTQGVISSPKPGGDSSRKRLAYLLRGMLDEDKAAILCNMISDGTVDFMDWHEAEHYQSSFQYKVLDNGDGAGIVQGGLRLVLEPFVVGKLLPFVRQHYNDPDLEVACAILRRTQAGSELSHAVPQDAAAYATAVLNLSDAKAFHGGMFVQGTPHLDSRSFVPLAAGDVMLHRYDLDHGISVSEGCWLSVVFWFRGLDAHVAPWLQDDAERGDSDAQALLGGSFHTGSQGRMPDQSLAFAWLGRAGEQGHLGAQCLLGTLYRHGTGVLASAARAEEWWRSAAAAGHAKSQRLLGTLLLESEDVRGAAEGIEWLNAAADQEDCDAMLALYGIHSEGRYGLPRNVGIATTCLSRAAQRGHTEAQCTLGFAYLAGEHMARSMEDALVWLGTAARGGAVEAQRILAGLFRGTPDKWDQSMHWYLEAAKRNDTSAMHELGLLALEVFASNSSPGIPRDDFEALGHAWLRVAALRNGGDSAGVEATPAGRSRLEPCLSALIAREFKRVTNPESIAAESGQLRKTLVDFTQQAVAVMQGHANSILPSWSFCMDFMSIHHKSDPLFRWGNNKGTVDFPRAVTHDHGGGFPVNKDAVVACEGWESAAPTAQRSIAEEAFSKLVANGYVVLERLLSLHLLDPLEAEFERLAASQVHTERLRAGRAQIALPFEPPWNQDWLVGNALVMEIVARYICNNDALACESNEDQAWAFADWIADGARAGYYIDAPAAQKANPSFGAIDVIYTPPRTMPQLRHRDTNLPGICASLTVTVPLTPLTHDNGPIGFVPGSHVLETPGVEVLACAPPGSVIIYDSFLEHRGCENVTQRPRSVLSMTFDPGVWMRSFDPASAGTTAWESHKAFRRKIDAHIRKAQASARGEACPDHSSMPSSGPGRETSADAGLRPYLGLAGW